MKGVLDLNRDNEWIVRYRAEDNDLLIHKSLPLSRFNKIMYKTQLEVDTEIEFSSSCERFNKSFAPRSPICELDTLGARRIKNAVTVVVVIASAVL
jgi:hypothetical protein